MNDKFDELAKGLAQSVTRRGALKKFGVGFAGMLLATFGLAKTSHRVCHCQKRPTMVAVVSIAHALASAVSSAKDSTLFDNLRCHYALSTACREATDSRA